MTKLGEYLTEKAVNYSAVARKTGIRNNRLSELVNKPNVHLRAKELYLIAISIGVNPCDMLDALYSDLKDTIKKK